jgi:hypothetical protein
VPPRTTRSPAISRLVPLVSGAGQVILVIGVRKVVNEDVGF